MSVMPAKAGIHLEARTSGDMESHARRFACAVRGNDT